MAEAMSTDSPKARRSLGLERLSHSKYPINELRRGQRGSAAEFVRKRSMQIRD